MVPVAEWRYARGGYVDLPQLLQDVSGQAFAPPPDQCARVAEPTALLWQRACSS